MDASHFFSADRSNEIHAVEPPLGCIAILSYLNERYGDRIYGKIIKTGVEVDSMEELFAAVSDFQPDLIMMRTLTYYKDFFVEIAGRLQNLLPDVPIIAGGPHPTIDPKDCLLRGGVQLCVIGEGKLICEEIVGFMLRVGRFPNAEELKEIKGIAFLDALSERAGREAVEDRAGYARYPLWGAATKAEA